MKKPLRDYVRASIKSADALVYQPCRTATSEGRQWLVVHPLTAIF